MARTVTIGGSRVGDDSPVFIVAEIGINHNGSLEMARQLITAAADAGCDAVKFQKRTPDRCVPSDQRDVPRATPWGILSYAEYRRRIEFGLAEYREIDRYCRALGIMWFASCWDEESVDFLRAFDVPCFKVASAGLTDADLLRCVRETGKPVVLSTGMSTLAQIDAAVAFLGVERLVLNHCTSTYPCPPSDLNLRMIETLRGRFTCPVGYSGHEVGLSTTVAAVTLGARLVERHITLDRALWGTDQAASIEPQGFERLVKYIRVVEEAMGSGLKEVYPDERPAMERLSAEPTRFDSPMPRGPSVREPVNRSGAHALAFVALAGLAWICYSGIFSIRPVVDDNLFIFSWADRAPASSLMSLEPYLYPEWRPVAYQTIWLEYRWLGLDSTGEYFLVNLVLWTSCAWMVFRIAADLGNSAIAAWIGAAFVLTDARALSTLIVIVDRQGSMACLFGLLACATAIRSETRGLTRAKWIGLTCALVLSALSKEYGLAFAAALGVYALMRRRKGLAFAVIAAVAVYGGLRMVFASGATAGYCEDMGYFFVERRVCMDAFDTQASAQMAYNAAATAVATLLPGLFGPHGEIGVTKFGLALGAILLAAASLAWTVGHRATRIGGLVLLFNALLSVMLFRSRNHVVGICGIGIAYGVGLPIAASMIRERLRGPLVTLAAASGLLVLLSVQVTRTRAAVEHEVAVSLAHDPCTELSPGGAKDRAVVRRLKLKYAMSNPDCESLP